MSIKGLEKASSFQGLATSFFPYFSPKRPPNNPPPLPPLSPLMASPSIHSRRKSLSFISATLVSLVCSCASCLLKANRVGILVIYIDSLMSLSSVMLPLVRPSSDHTPYIYFSVSTYKDCALGWRRWVQEHTALPRLPE